MPSIDSLVSRVNAELARVAEKARESQEQQRQGADRSRRLEQFTKASRRLREFVVPRLQVLLDRFAELVQSRPAIESLARQLTMSFKSSVARVVLKWSAAPDPEVRKMILNYHLEILPAWTDYEPHARFEVPLDAMDEEAITAWVDDRIVAFVRTYVGLLAADDGLRDQMVEDPVAKVRFPKVCAQETLEWEGRTYYVLGEETRQEFEMQHGSGPEGEC